MRTQAPGSRRRRRFLRRHPMGLPSVFFVALLAGAGFWWTVNSPDTTGNFAASDESTIPRGCLLDVQELCDASVTQLALMSDLPVGAHTLCEAGAMEGFVEVWRGEGGQVGMRWDLPRSSPTQPLASPWVVAWIGGSALHVSNEWEGWALLPDTFAQASVTAWAGTTGLGGDLRDGLDSLLIEPFAIAEDGTPRLAAHVNGDAIIIEVPATREFDLVRTDEQLRFDPWTTGRLSCDTTALAE